MEKIFYQRVAFYLGTIILIMTGYFSGFNKTFQRRHPDFESWLFMVSALTLLPLYFQKPKQIIKDVLFKKD